MNSARSYRNPAAKWRSVTFEPTEDRLFEGLGGLHDVAGDGSMILPPTPGPHRGLHTRNVGRVFRVNGALDHGLIGVSPGLVTAIRGSFGG